MKYWTRKYNSQRTSADATLEVDLTNTAGQGGVPIITLWDAQDKRWHLLRLESVEDWKNLLSAVQTAGAHVRRAPAKILHFKGNSSDGI